MNVFDGADVQAPGGLDSDQHLRIFVNFAGNDGFLLVAAGHCAGGGDGSLTGADIILFDQLVRILPDIFPAQEADPVRESGFKIGLENHVVLQGVIQHQAVLVPVFRNMAHS